ncbi:MAG TPA: transglutaminase family protein [Pseudolabrys sp.]|nr:transglutaminase family protein [Pseudolabrys sp.]
MPASDFLQPSAFIDSGNAAVRAFARDAVGDTQGERSRAIALYNAVRDGIVYDPYLDYTDLGVFRASSVLTSGRGFCIGKSALLAACARAAGIPARAGFADVRNHMTSKRLRALTESDTFIWHSYTELMIEGAWVKCTPAFDNTLCMRAGLAPLEFDGITDSLFHAFDPAGRRHMEYLNDRGTYIDVPVDAILADFRRHYPLLIANGRPTGDFHAEVVT